MKVLGIESTCDETSASVVEDGRKILSHVIASQGAIHSPFGGVVPELASRHHAEDIVPVVQSCMQQSLLSFSDLDLVAVAHGPGLIGSLLVGIHFAQALAWSIQKPLVGINHVEAHLYAAMMHCPQPTSYFPALGLILSGGHSTLLYVHDVGRYSCIGYTVDDALGEAFDKVAHMLSLGYPGGPLVEQCAKQGDPHAHAFHGGRVKNNPYAFSFSGLKTAVLYAIQQGNSSPEDICASFQYAAGTSVCDKVKKACAEYEPKALFLGGGVSQNQTIRAMLSSACSVPIFWPEATMCLDNAAMIAGLGYHVWNRSHLDETTTLTPKTRIAWS